MKEYIWMATETCADDAGSNFIFSNAEKLDMIISAKLTISVRKETASVGLSNDITFQLN